MPDSAEEHGDNWRIEPLTRRNAQGEVYRREPVVDLQIRSAVRLDGDALRARAAVNDPESSDFLKEESLVYLIRHYQREDDPRLVSDLAETILGRCAILIDRRLRSLGPDTAREGYQMIVERLFSPMLEVDTDRGDFLEVRFWVALERIAVRAYNRLLAELRRGQHAVPLSSLAGYDDDEGDEAPRAPVQIAANATTPPVDSAVIQIELIRAALACLDEPFREAFLLRHHAGWPVEDRDPGVRTISRHFGKTPRTIRNWLNKAEESLKTWRGEQQ
jgi:hypothetical protein